MGQFALESKWERKEMHSDPFIFLFGTLGCFYMTLANVHWNSSLKLPQPPKLLAQAVISYQGGLQMP